MDSGLPSRIDRATFDRVLQRAAELQAASREIGDGLTEEEILALGAEVGIPTAHLQQALIEERTRIAAPPANGVLDRWIWPADLQAQRVVQGTPELVSAALARWLETHEHFLVQRQSGGRMTFEPMEAFAKAMRRIGAAFGRARVKPHLTDVQHVAAVITPLESGFSHVSLAASLRKARAGYVSGGAALALTGVAMSGALTLAPVAPLLDVAPVIVMSLAGWSVARVFRSRAQRAQLGLERALDDLEHRPALPRERLVSGASAMTGQQVGKVLREIADEVRKSFDK